MQFRRWPVVVFLISSIVTGFGIPVISAEALVPVGLQKQLLVDDFIIAEMQNVTRELGEVKKHGVVLEPTLPTDFVPPRGQSGGDLSSLRGKAVRFRFTLRNARLYSFGLSQHS